MQGVLIWKQYSGCFPQGTVFAEVRGLAQGQHGLYLRREFNQSGTGGILNVDLNGARKVRNGLRALPTLSSIFRSFPGSLGTMTPSDPQSSTYNQAPGAFAPYLQLRTLKAMTSRGMDWLSLRIGTAFILSPHCAPIWDKIRLAHQQCSPHSTAEGSGTLNEVHTQANLEGRSGSCWVCAQGSSSGA